MTIRRLAATVIAVGTAVSTLTLIESPADASGLFDNCTNYNHRFPHGVGRRHAHDHTTGDPVTNFVRSNRKYRRAMHHNSNLDRDRDKIACEKA